MTEDFDPVARLEELAPFLTEPLILPMKLFRLEDGRPCPTFLLFEVEDEVSVVSFTMPAGGVFVAHQHDQFECLIPYSGTLINLESGKKAGPKSVLYMGPGEPHRIKAITDVAGIGITVPSSPGYPHAAG